MKTWKTIIEAAAILGCSERTIRRHMKEGKLNHTHSGRKLYIEVEEPDRINESIGRMSDAATATAVSRSRDQEQLSAVMHAADQSILWARVAVVVLFAAFCGLGWRYLDRVEQNAGEVIALSGQVSKLENQVANADRETQKAEGDRDRINQELTGTRAALDAYVIADAYLIDD